MKTRKIPYFSNENDDNTYCLLACIRMLLKYYFPAQDYSWEKLEEITNKPVGKWAWPMAGLVYLDKIGLETIHITNIDYSKFVRKGEIYLQQYFLDRFQEQKDNCNFILARTDAKFLLDSGVRYDKRIPDSTDLSNLLKSNYKIICYVGRSHFVVVYSIGGGNVYFHNPGINGKESASMKECDFYQYWSNGQLLAFRNNSS